MVDDQLPAAVEQVGQAELAARSLERVVLFDPHDGQPAPVGVRLVHGPGELLLLGQVRFPGDEPVFAGHDLG
ncbi:MAG TPA: hypothetical protein VFX16_00380 [Pseudonocardiaceae bacterium]|nr:hypothetical protein [Pseudonocardiaceae bacterium]